MSTADDIAATKARILELLDSIAAKRAKLKAELDLHAWVASARSEGTASAQRINTAPLAHRQPCVYGTCNYPEGECAGLCPRVDVRSQP